MAITYNAGTDTITVTGYTSGTPCTFLDVYNADVAGAWGKVTTQCGNRQFCFTCKLLQIGDGSTATWFADTQKMVYLNYSTASSSDRFIVKANAHAIFGTLDANSFGKEGCTLLVNGYDTLKNYGELDFYGCCVGTITTLNAWSPIILYAGSTYKIYDTIFDKMYVPMWIMGTPSTFEAYRITSTEPDLGLRAAVNVAFSNMTVFNPGRANIFVQGGAVITATDCDFPQDPTYSMWVYTGGGTINLVNPAQSIYTHYWTANGNIYYKYHFDLKVIDKDNVAINGATVKIWDKDSNLIVDTTTNASGVITQQTIIAKHYTQSTSLNKNPFLIKIEKAGYTMYEADFTLGDKTDWLIALQTSILRNPSMSGGMV